MTTAHEKLAKSLAELHKLQADGRRVFKSGALARTDGDRLIRAGFLRRVMKGWLISSSPGDDGDTTPWYTSFWEFCARYCTERFDDEWHLSPEQSLLLSAEHTVIPSQVIVYTPKGTNNTVGLLHGMSLYDLRQKRMPPSDDLVVRDGLRIFTPEAALARLPESFYHRFPVEAATALSNINDGSGLLRRLLDGGHSAVAGRLAGVLRNIGNKELADEILKTMHAAGYDVRKSDPFKGDQEFGTTTSDATAMEKRLRALWEAMRQTVFDVFPEAPGPPDDPDAYLRHVSDLYQNDAYHSLSIEGYRVTADLIERVRSGEWDPDGRGEDRRSRDALAARGYWQAFQHVRDAVGKVLSSESPGQLARNGHREWYRELFQPSVAAGLIPASALAGYRGEPVFIRGSRHVPPRREAVPDAMATLFNLLGDETEPGVQAVLGHWLFGYIHPYTDGNGRVARFLMNVMLASGGYPWVVIQVDDRELYLSALEMASVEQNIEPFARFLAERTAWSLAQTGET